MSVSSFSLQPTKPNTDLLRWLATDFPESQNILARLLVDGTGRQPLMYDHVEIILRTFRYPYKDNPFSFDIDLLRRAYVYLTAVYFFVDAVSDNHSRGEGNEDVSTTQIARFIAPLTTYACIGFAEFAPLSTEMRGKILSLVASHLNDNRRALAAEDKFRNDQFNPCVMEEKESIVGRANTLIILIDVLNSMIQYEFSSQIRKQACDFLFYFQLGDDLSDWRKDFHEGKHTSFLRTIWHQCGRVLTESELEEYVYLSGIYEERLYEVINGFKHVAESIQKIPQAKPFEQYVKSNLETAWSALKGFEEVKRKEDLYGANNHLACGFWS